MKTASAKAKGRRLCAWLKERLLSSFPILETDDIRVTSSGATGEDITLSPKARDAVPWQFECKSRASMSIYRDYEQAVSHGPFEAVVICREDRKEPLAVMSAATFFELIKRTP